MIRGLNEIGYDGPLAVEWKDPGMDREFGAEDACKFVKRLSFPAPPRKGGGFPLGGCNLEYGWSTPPFQNAPSTHTCSGL